MRENTAWVADMRGIASQDIHTVIPLKITGIRSRVSSQSKRIKFRIKKSGFTDNTDGQIPFALEQAESGAPFTSSFLT